MTASCPLCNLTLPLAELELHVNLHFENEDGEQIAEDQRLALEIASSSLRFDDSRSRRSDSPIADEKISCLVSLQSRDSFHPVRGGLLFLLKDRLELELKSVRSKSQECLTVLSGYVDHYQSLESEDVGWGCGWRNIQMLCSHLIREREEARSVLFGGCGFVPDIASLQRWLEIAWERGFDAPGSLHFDRKVYGTAKWIGTTECAALLRSFGIRARIVDFSPKESLRRHLSVPGTALAEPPRAHGPMDRYLLPVNQRQKGEGASVSVPNNSRGKINKQQILIDWIWSYFTDKSFVTSGVRISSKAPLYFQHDGHSRTIVGIQKHQQGMKSSCNLFILDPVHKTAQLESSLVEGTAWQKFIKRGSHTLGQSQYQLCYVDPGIATGEELEKLKILNSSFIEY